MTALSDLRHACDPCAVGWWGPRGSLCWNCQQPGRIDMPGITVADGGERPSWYRRMTTGSGR